MFQFIDGPGGYDLQSTESKQKYGFLGKCKNTYYAVLCLPVHAEEKFNDIGDAKQWMLSTLDKNLKDIEAKYNQTNSGHLLYLISDTGCIMDVQQAGLDK